MCLNTFEMLKYVFMRARREEKQNCGRQEILEETDKKCGKNGDDTFLCVLIRRLNQRADIHLKFSGKSMEFATDPSSYNIQFVLNIFDI